MSGVQDDDPELRRLLSSIGLDGQSQHEDGRGAEGWLRAEAMLAEVLLQPRVAAPAATGSGSRSLVRRQSLVLAATMCALIITFLVFVPGSGLRPAAAQTPPLLSFQGARELPASGKPARARLQLLAVRAAELPPAPDYPVQWITMEGWAASTDPAAGSEDARSVLVPRHTDVYQFEDGQRRSIERRSAVIDANGGLTDQPGSWDDVQAEADETFTNDQGANYPEKLPTDVAGLARVLAPEAGCAGVTGGCLLSAVSDMFSSYVVSPAVTARLWRALASDPTVKDLGDTTDRLGRKAAVFVADAPDGVQRTLLLLDPRTGQYLGVESVLVKPSQDFGFQPPAVTQFSALLQANRIPTSSVPDDSTTTTY